MDRKSNSDKLARIHRPWLGYEPMEIQFIDVKPLDLVMRRLDGTEGWPKAIVFLDAYSSTSSFVLSAKAYDKNTSGPP